MEIILWLFIIFVSITLLGWFITLVKVRTGKIKHGYEAIEEYWDNVRLALLLTGFLLLLSIESWIG